MPQGTPEGPGPAAPKDRLYCRIAPTLSPLWTLPFAGMLLAIAVLPLSAPHWWERDRNKLGLSLLLGLPVVWRYAGHRPAALVETAEDYVAFVILLAGLYTAAGGIRLRAKLAPGPGVNTLLLAGGSLLASLIGTTGASMLLIRPLLAVNRERTRQAHTVIFFIFLVSNIGGMLTPLGDPPLFLGYLQGVPFLWTLRLWPQWALMVGILLAVYAALDTWAWRREPADVRHPAPPRAAGDGPALEGPRGRRVDGLMNIGWLVGIVLAVALLRAPWREAAIVAAGGLSLWLTPWEVRRANGFSRGPMVEVAVLFFGIFLTMIPALELLRTRGGELGVREPWQFFWAAGTLSSFLDNAPTYLTFLALAQGQGLAAEVAGVPERVLAAISVGAVAMGANSYIGNAPNFMVKAIAEEAGVRMPSFVGYLAWSATILLPLFALVTLAAFR